MDIGRGPCSHDLLKAVFQRKISQGPRTSARVFTTYPSLLYAPLRSSARLVYGDGIALDGISKQHYSGGLSRCRVSRKLHVFNRGDEISNVCGAATLLQRHSFASLILPHLLFTAWVSISSSYKWQWSTRGSLEKKSSPFQEYGSGVASATRNS